MGALPATMPAFPRFVREAPAAPAPVRVRQLPAEEWGRLAQVPPFDSGVPLTISPQADKVVVVEEVETGRIVGYWMAFLAVHVEPMWIDPEHRGRVGVIRKLWRGATDAVAEFGAEMAFALVHPENPAAEYAQRLGFQRTLGDCYFVITRKATPETRERVVQFSRVARETEGG